MTCCSRLVSSIDFSDKGDLEKIKKRINKKQSVANVLSLNSLEDGDTNNDIPSPGTNGITLQTLKTGCMIARQNGETLEQFCCRVTNVYLRKRHINLLSFGTMELMLSNLRHLDLSNNNICVIDNLQNFVQLEVLQLQSNSIYEISNLDKLKRLRILNLRNNMISIIKGISSLLHLHELDIACQGHENGLLLSTNCFENSVGLRILRLEHNMIHDASQLGYLCTIKSSFI